MTAAPPSGAQYRVVSGDQEATVVEVGGGLRTFTVGDDGSATSSSTPPTDLTGDRAVVAAPGDGRRVVLRDASYRWLMVFTGDTPDPAHRRRSLALEPMTCAPTAFVTGGGLRVLEPEESWTTTWGIAATRGR